MTKYEVLKLFFNKPNYSITHNEIKNCTSYEYLEFQDVIRNLDLQTSIATTYEYPNGLQQDEMGQQIYTDQIIRFTLTPKGKDTFINTRRQRRLEFWGNFRSWIAIGLSILALWISALAYLK